MSHEPRHRILVVDDQVDIHADYRKILGQESSTSASAVGKAAAELFGDDPSQLVDWEGFELDSAFQGQEGLELVKRSIAQRRPYAMAFVDIRMPPGWDGVETVRHIWEVDPEVLIVICSAYSDYSWDEMVRQLGRNDRYLILKKPFDNIEVRQCAMALTERWSVSRTDVLTGLLNRRAFGSYLELEWSRSTRHALPLACAMVDLDDFKRVNDTLGHYTGDVVLKNLAATLEAGCRATDLVCRYGGDEICVLLPHTTEADAVAWAENTRRTIESTPTLVGRQSVATTASIGVAQRVAQRVADDDCTERLIDRADQSLIAAKSAGRNHVVSFSATIAAGRHPSPPPVRAWEGMTLQDVMASPAVLLRPDATAGEAAKRLLAADADCAPIVDCQGSLIGALSADDLVASFSNPQAWYAPVERLMGRSFPHFEQDAPLPSICRVLTETPARQVVVVRGGRPIGIVDRRSLLRWQNRRMTGPPGAAPPIVAPGSTCDHWQTPPAPGAPAG